MGLVFLVIQDNMEEVLNLGVLLAILYAKLVMGHQILNVQGVITILISLITQLISVYLVQQDTMEMI